MGEQTEVNFQQLYEDLENPDVKKIESILYKRENNLSFPEEYEKGFCQHYAKKFANHIRLAMFIGIGMFLSSYFFDFINVPDETVSWLIRFGIVGPVLLIVAFLSYSRFYHQIQQELILLSAIGLSLGVLGITYHMPEPMRTMYINGIILVMIYALCFSRMRFWNAIKFTAVNFIAINFLLMLETDTTISLALAHNYIFLVGCTLLLVNNYFLEYAERQEYLQDLIIKTENKQLEIINDRLHQLANQDGLTGLANFRHFDSMLAAEWTRGLRYSYPISLIIVDIDYFKALNDTYGHQYGDDSIMAVANSLKPMARRPGDLSARFGGDEFVIMLVDTDNVNSMRIAEEIRTNVASLQLCNENSKAASFVTITCGVATIVPDQNTDPNTLFKQADDALYLAKQRGRNSVASYSEIPQSKTA